MDVGCIHADGILQSAGQVLLALFNLPGMSISCPQQIWSLELAEAGFDSSFETACARRSCGVAFGESASNRVFCHPRPDAACALILLGLSGAPWTGAGVVTGKIIWPPACRVKAHGTRQASGDGPYFGLGYHLEVDRYS